MLLPSQKLPSHGQGVWGLERYPRVPVARDTKRRNTKRCPVIGCRTCRKRRVKCDERQPSCVRCERGSFDCEGFSSNLRFVIENSRAKRRSVKQEVLRAKAFERGKGSPEQFPITESDKSIVLSRFHTVPTAPVTLWPELNLAAFKNEIQISFTLAKLFSWDKRSVTWLGWGYNAVEQSINSDALKALSGIYYGRVHHEFSLENAARVHYLKTLRGLGKAIGSHAGISLDALIAGMTASCYEMIASPTHAGTLLHAGGVGSLIELRGPEQHRSRFELNLFNTMRTSICMKAIFDRKRCFLEKDEWKTIPWSLFPEEKTMVTWVQDIMCNVPGLLEDYDALSAPNLSPEMYQFRLKNLSAKINNHLKLLSDWRALWEQLYPGICHEMPSQFPQSPFSKALHYHDIEVANGLMLYNALYIRLSELGMRLLGPDYDYRQVAKETSFKCTNPLLNHAGASLHDAAIEICRSVEYHLSPPHGSAGAFFIIFPLKKAYDVLPSGTAEKEWLEAIITNLATNRGFLFLWGVFSQRVL